MDFNRRQSTSNCSYEPFMLGSSPYGVGVAQSASASGFGQGVRSSVRDCMQWDSSSGMGGNGGGFWNSGSPEGMGNSMNGITSSMGFSYGQAQPKAYVTTGGQGEAGGRPGNGGGVSIPCQLAPLGTNPASYMKPMEPVTLRVTAPSPTTNSNGTRGPFTFTIDPTQIYGNKRQ